jgi:hypothetical protein
MRRRRAIRTGVWGVMVLSFSGWMGAQAAPAGRIDPAADRVLRRMSRYLQAQRQFRVEVRELYDEVRGSGQRIQYSRQRSVAVRRPNRMYSDARGDAGGRRFWYDGKSVTLLDPQRNLYASTKAARDIDTTLDLVVRTYGLHLPLMDLLARDPYAALTEHVTSGLYMGIHSVDETPAHHLAFTQENVDWQIWIDTGASPLPRKVVITYKQLPGQPQFQATTTAWDTIARLSDATFQFRRPKRAAKIEIVPFGKQPPNVRKP